jgi:RNA polymerase sigma-70 factor (sigma-E family)
VLRPRDEDFEKYVRDRRAGLLRFAMVLTSGDGYIAEDLVQTALTRLYVAWPRARSFSVDVYTRRIIVNALIDEKRRPAARQETSTAEPPEGALPDEVSGTTSDSDLLQALAALPSGMRAAVVLRHVEGLSVAETARTLRCSQGNVKSQTARGLDRLRELLAEASPSICSRLTTSQEKP